MSDLLPLASEGLPPCRTCGHPPHDGDACVVMMCYCTQALIRPAMPFYVNDLHCGPEICAACRQEIARRLAAPRALPKTVVAVLMALSGCMAMLPANVERARAAWVAAGRPGLEEK